MVRQDNSNLILNILTGIIFVALIAYIVIAAVGDTESQTATLVSPIDGGNYSYTSMDFNCTVVEANDSEATGYNVSLMYNVSGGALDTNSSVLVTIQNTSANNLSAFNGTVDLSSVTDGSYNFSCMGDNSSHKEWSDAGNITIDRTAPVIDSIGGDIQDGGNYSTEAELLINISITDALIGIKEADGASVYINITNASDGTEINFTKVANLNSQDAGNNSGNYTHNMSAIASFIDGWYNITPYTNDTLNNINSTEAQTITISIDNTAPVISNFSCSPLDENSQIRSGSTLTCACTVSDDIDPGVNVSFTQNPVTSNKGTFTTTCTTQDNQANSASESVTFSVVGSLSTGGGSGGSGSSRTVWTSSFVYNDKNLDEKEPLTRELGKKSRIKIKVNNINHHVGVTAVTETTATIEVASTPQTAELSIGDVKKFDLTDDGFYDLKVTLNKIINNKADLTIESISALKEEVPEGEAAGDTSAGTGTGALGAEKTNLLWLWILIGVIVVAVVIYFIYKAKK